MAATPEMLMPAEISVLMFPETVTALLPLVVLNVAVPPSMDWALASTSSPLVVSPYPRLKTTVLPV